MRAIGHGYTLSTLARYFGVNDTTLITWIGQHRFIGITWDGEEPSHTIHDGTLWVARTGHIHPVGDIVDSWFDEETGHTLDIQTHLDAFERQYQGEYDDTLGRKPIYSLTAQEESDASLWRYFLRQRVRRSKS